jgi:hypothetical protein
MNWEKCVSEFRYLYHYTSRTNAEKIIREKKLETGSDRFVFFATSLEDSRLMFHELMGRIGSPYYDENMNRRYREITNSDDYVILQIPYKTDGKYYRFILPHSQETFSAYDYALAHYGAYEFSEATLFPINEVIEETVVSLAELAPKKRCATAKHVSRIAASIACSVLIAGSPLIMPLNAEAAPEGNWLDPGNYDVDWYTPSASTYEINTAKDLAGLAYLVNHDDIYFDSRYINLNDDVDLSAHTWTNIDGKFLGTIEGVHNIVLCPEDYENNEYIFATPPKNLDAEWSITTTLSGAIKIDTEGTLTPKDILSVNTSQIIPSKSVSTLIYQWQISDEVTSKDVGELSALAVPTFSDIPGETASTYQILDEDVGKTIRVRITSSNSTTFAGELFGTVNIPLPKNENNETTPLSPKTADAAIPILPLAAMGVSAVALIALVLKK